MTTRSCVECETPLNGYQRSGYCAACKRDRCRYCNAALPPERLTEAMRRSCAACSRQRYDRTRAKVKADPRCTYCRREIEPWRTNPICTDCRAEQYETERRALLKQPDRKCRDCGANLLLGRRVDRCVPCYRRYKQGLPNRRQPCPGCGKRSRCRGSAYCRPCKTLYDNWLAAYHAGDPAAKLVRPKRAPYRRWQQPEANP